MRSKSFPALTLGLLVVGLTLLVWTDPFGKGDPAGASSTARAFDFAISRVETSPRGEGPEMFGFLVRTDEAGRPRLEQSFRVRGEAPGLETLPDHGRVWKWSLLDLRGEVLAEGRHFEMLARYTPSQEGGCEKTLEPTGTMMIRCPAPAGAKTLRLELERVTTDEEGLH